MRLLDIRNELKVTLKQTMDDREISDLQIDYWIKVAADTLRWKVLKLQGIQDQERSGAYLRRFVEDIVTDNSAQDKTCLKYVELPEKIYDYELDLGVDGMAYYSNAECTNCPPIFTRVKFGRTTYSSAQSLYMSEDQKPSAKQPYFFRVNDRLYLLGLEQSPSISQVEMLLFTNLPDIRDIDPSAELPIADELLSELRKAVIENARVMLLIPEEDGINEGNARSTMTRLTLPKQTSVNEMTASDQ